VRLEILPSAFVPHDESRTFRIHGNNVSQTVEREKHRRSVVGYAYTSVDPYPLCVLIFQTTTLTRGYLPRESNRFFDRVSCRFLTRRLLFHLVSLRAHGSNFYFFFPPFFCASAVFSLAVQNVFGQLFGAVQSHVKRSPENPSQHLCRTRTRNKSLPLHRWHRQRFLRCRETARSVFHLPRHSTAARPRQPRARRKKKPNRSESISRVANLNTIFFFFDTRFFFVFRVSATDLALYCLFLRARKVFITRVFLSFHRFVSKERQTYRDEFMQRFQCLF
jgi:hypothetical protein